MATDITVNTSGTILSIAVDKTDYPNATHPPFIDIAISNLKMEKGAATSDELVITDTSNTQRYPFSTTIGTITVATVAATNNADLRTKILAAV